MAKSKNKKKEPGQVSVPKFDSLRVIEPLTKSQEKAFAAFRKVSGGEGRDRQVYRPDP